MKALGEKFADEFPVKAAEIRSLWDGVEGGDSDALQSLYRVVHTLAGSGETFGFPKLSEVAKQCEIVLLAGVESGQLQCGDAGAEVELVLAELDR